jgi:mRNA interferase HicA
LRYREVSRKLRALNCVELPRRGGGSHRKWLNSSNNQATIVPDWGTKDLKSGTLQAIVRQLGLKWRDFQQS